MKVLICEICGEQIASIIDVKFPMQGSMFGALAPHLPSPFGIMQHWIDMKCPHCRYRPFTEEDKILTDDGYIDLNEPIEPIQKVPYGSDWISSGVVVGFGNSSDENALPEVTDSEGTKVAEQPEKAKGSEADGQGRTFEGLLESGAIKQHGSWYEYEDKNYRKGDLIDYLEGK